MKREDQAVWRRPDRGRRRLLGALGVVPMGALTAGWGVVPLGWSAGRTKCRAVLISSTTVSGKKSLEHAADELKALYAGVRRILLINFASLPPARDAYARRIQSDFSRLDSRFEVRSLHAARGGEALRWVEQAEAYFVSGGNTFLLVRELLDRGVLETLSERVWGGVPYAGSSAGSNLAGTVIGTTNDFPLVDIPSRRALGMLPGTYNPHHPDLAEEAAYGSRQWKIGEYAAYHPEELIFGVNNAGLIRMEGELMSLCGEGAEATLRLAEEVETVVGPRDGAISAAVEALRERVARSAEVAT
jgi:dipeptidase E